MYTLEISHDHGTTFNPFNDDLETTATITNVVVNGVDVSAPIQDHYDLVNFNSVLSSVEDSHGIEFVDLFIRLINGGHTEYDNADILEELEGPYNSGGDFAEQSLEELGYLDSVPDYLISAIDWEQVWESTLRHDYFEVEGTDWDYYYIHAH